MNSKLQLDKPMSKEAVKPVNINNVNINSAITLKGSYLG